jgi:hypothetical protein
LHWKLAGSSAENDTLAVELLLSADGPDVTDTAGARVSIVQAYVASGPTFERASAAFTTNVCRPSVRSLKSCGDAHDAKAAPSSLH